MFKSILVPLDGSSFAEHSLPLAAYVGRQSGATIRLLQVLPPLADRFFWAPLPGSQLGHDLQDHYQQQAQKYLQSVCERLKGGLRTTCDMVDEHIDICEAIDTSVTKMGIDLVVMASHGRGTFKRFWLGSIADDVYRSSPVPVLLARPQEKNVDEKVDLVNEPQVRHIVVALDGAEPAEQVLAPAVTFGKATEAELLLVRVISRPCNASGDPLKDVASESLEKERLQAANYLHAVSEMLQAQGVRVRTQLLASGDPADAIVQASAGADLIAIQTRARRGVSRLVHGSVVDKVVQNSAVPVLINRPHT